MISKPNGIVTYISALELPTLPTRPIVAPPLTLRGKLTPIETITPTKKIASQNPNFHEGGVVYHNNGEEGEGGIEARIDQTKMVTHRRERLEFWSSGGKPTPHNKKMVQMGRVQ